MWRAPAHASLESRSRPRAQVQGASLVGQDPLARDDNLTSYASFNVDHCEEVRDV